MDHSIADGVIANDVTLTKVKPWQRQALRWAAITVIVAVTLLPGLGIANILVTTGANNLSSDDGIFNSRFLDKVLDGTYHWQNFPRDTFFDPHSLLVPALAYIGLAYFADSNVYVALCLGLLLAAVKLLLLHSALTQTNQKRKRWERWLLWPLLAALVFSLSQISSYEHSMTAVGGGIMSLGLALGVWALTRFPGQWRGVTLMVVGGIVATLSSGAGLIMWPTFLIGLIFLGFRKLSHYAFWFTAAALSAVPYLFFLFLDPRRGSRAQSTLQSPFNYLFMLGTLGRPFANGINADYSSEMPIPLRIGLLGLALGVMGLALLWQRRRTRALAQSAPALMLVVFSLLTIWQISLFRGGIPPWYTFISIIFWIGLLGLAYAMWTNAAVGPDPGRRGYKLQYLIARVWSVVVVVGLVLLYVSSNLTYADKTVFLRTRAPASAACLRNYRNAPTYCEETLVVWPLGKTGYLPMLAEPLERHHLSVFAPQQEWTLQGDFILDSVRIDETPGIPDIFWSADLTATPVAWRDYRHLNLFLHTPNSISWTFSLPSNVERADFHSAIAISQSVPFDPTEDGVQFEVHIKPEGGADELAFGQYAAADQHQWQPFTIPLSAYAGQTVTLRLTSSGGANITGDWAMYRYPYIDLRLDPAKDAPAVPAKPFIPTLTAADVRFDITDSNLWQTSNMLPMSAEIEGVKAWTLNSDPSMQFNRPLDLNLADYTHFYLRLAASPDNYPMTLQILYRLSDAPALARRITIPLFADGEMHEYTYDLKLLELDQRVRLTGIGLGPAREGPFTGMSWMKISDFRLIRGSKPADQGAQAQPRLAAGTLDSNDHQMTTVADLIGLTNSPQARKQPDDPVKNADLVRVSAFTIAGTTRQVLYMHPASAVTYTLRLPTHAHLQTSLALDPQTWQVGKGDGVEYIVYVKAAGGSSRKVLDRYIDPKNIVDDRKWHDLSIDLSAYGGQQVALTLTTLPGPRGDTTYDWAGWGNPQIVVFETEDSSSKLSSKKPAR
jgi:MFS family permease